MNAVANLTGRRMIVLAYLLACWAGGPSSAAAGAEGQRQRVTFPGVVAQPGAFAQRLAKRQGRMLAVDTPVELRGTLFRPAGMIVRGDRMPAVILIPDCRGARPYQAAWAQQLNNWGYAALLLDTPGSRDSGEHCLEPAAMQSKRVYDVFGARAYLAGRADIDPYRIGVMGWGYAPALAAVAKYGSGQFFARPFMAAVAFYPDCGFYRSGEFIAPVLILAGDADDWTPAAQCRRLAANSNRTREPAELRVYPGAQHGFDDAGLVAPVVLSRVRNYYRDPALGATLAFNAAAASAAPARVKQFLDLKLRFRPLQMTLDELPPAVSAAQAAAGVWVSDPNDPGPDLPSAGESLFDRVFTVARDGRRVYDIPFPFAAFVARLETMVAEQAPGVSSLKKVLVPMGRSLQRNAATPDFFRYPRVVLAVDTQPPIRDGRRGRYLKDRFYIGYQERARAIEAISYNEQAQRFEFQVVKDYGPGLTPRVYYANRQVCTSCHQGHTPIFANAPWDETNVNGDVIERLQAVRSSFYGMSPTPALNAANDVDRSINRATLLPASYRIWSDGCGGEVLDRDTVGCRAGMFAGMLQYRLSNSTDFDRRSPTFRDFIDVQTRQWRMRWPGGLLIPAANIPDRNPFETRHTVSAKFDPLIRRLPEARWTAGNMRDMTETIRNLANDLVAQDVATLDRQLFAAGQVSQVAREKFETQCRFDRDRRRAPVYRAAIDCVAAPGGERRGFRLRGRVEIDPASRSVKGSILQLASGPAINLLDLRFDGTLIQRGGTWQARVPLYHRGHALHARLADGRAVEWLELALRPAHGTEFDMTMAGIARLQVMDDFKPVRSALASLARDTLRGAGSQFTAAPFHGTRAMAALFAKLGLPAVRLCCAVDRMPMPPKQVDPGDGSTGRLAELASRDNPALGLFYRYCSACHRTGEPLPPSFLSGDPATVQRNLEICAPRIAFRLHMWRLPAAQRPKTTMPPLLPVRPDHTDRYGSEAWRNSPDLAALTRFAVAALDIDGSEQQRFKRLLDRGYANLPQCTLPTAAPPY